MATDFDDDRNKGLIAENIFENDYLSFFNIPFKDVSKNPAYQKKDIDYVVAGGKGYEVKNNYKDDEKLFIEDYADYNEELGIKKEGWWYKSEANWIVFVSDETRTMIFLKRTKQLYDRYEEIKENYQLHSYTTSYRNDSDSTWQSAFRVVPLSEFEGFYSFHWKSAKKEPEEIISDDPVPANAPLISKEDSEVLLNLI